MFSLSVSVRDWNLLFVIFFVKYCGVFAHSIICIITLLIQVSILINKKQKMVECLRRCTAYSFSEFVRVISYFQNGDKQI